MKISVVTVCLNAEDTIERTIESVLGQDYGDIEYIIIDGMSEDQTGRILSRYEAIPNVKIVVQKDTGLYNAMNKGIDLCSGDYIIYLNSGDVFTEKKILSQVACRARAEIVFGNVVRVFRERERLEKYQGRWYAFLLMLTGKMPCHQAIFVQREVMIKYRFDENYRICADFDFIVRCLRDKVSMQHVDVTVSRVDCVEGVSSQKENLEQMRVEDDRSIRKNFPGWYWILKMPKAWVRWGKRIQDCSLCQHSSGKNR